MSKQRTTVSLEEGLMEKLAALMKLRDFGGNQSAFLSQLVREEYERRHGPVLFKQPKQPVASSPSPLKSGTVKAKGNRNKGRAKEQASN